MGNLILPLYRQRKQPSGSRGAGMLAAALMMTAFSTMTGNAMAQDEESERHKRAQKTEVWQPVPPEVIARPDQPPSDAIVLFNGTDLSQWTTLDGDAAPWQVENNTLTVKPGSGDIKTKRSFCDVQLHLEWRTPTGSEDLTGQQRHNSGVFLQQRYEVQILDSYQNKTYSNGQAASIYKQSIPLVNAMRPPGEWQEYDIIFTAPRFEGKELSSPGYLTVLHNGVLVQNHVKIKGTTVYIGEPKYEAHGCAPIQLQDHGNPVNFRNIWIREL